MTVVVVCHYGTLFDQLKEAEVVQSIYCTILLKLYFTLGSHGICVKEGNGGAIPDFIQHSAVDILDSLYCGMSVLWICLKIFLFLFFSFYNPLF